MVLKGKSNSLVTCEGKRTGSVKKMGGDKKEGGLLIFEREGKKVWSSPLLGGKPYRLFLRGGGEGGRGDCMTEREGREHDHGRLWEGRVGFLLSGLSRLDLSSCLLEEKKKGRRNREKKKEEKRK